jgi:preprotein translocase subunit SecD
VSIGVSLDSNIVYFEHMKEDIRNGRTPRSASERSFKGAFSTVVKADVASLIGAAVLYFFTVGAVRGFAFYLGLAMVLDLAATYFFLGPAVQLLARRPGFSAHPERYGLPSGPAHAPAPDAVDVPSPEVVG